jgi:hypothetical protein
MQWWCIKVKCELGVICMQVHLWQVLSLRLTSSQWPVHGYCACSDIDDDLSASVYATVVNITVLLHNTTHWLLSQ